jgi:hypothetical protein
VCDVSTSSSIKINDEYYLIPVLLTAINGIDGQECSQFTSVPHDSVASADANNNLDTRVPVLLTAINGIVDCQECSSVPPEQLPGFSPPAISPLSRVFCTTQWLLQM